MRWGEEAVKHSQPIFPHMFKVNNASKDKNSSVIMGEAMDADSRLIDEARCATFESKSYALLDVQCVCTETGCGEVGQERRNRLPDTQRSLPGGALF
jgi:hypothetical protein